MFRAGSGQVYGILAIVRYYKEAVCCTLVKQLGTDCRDPAMSINDRIGWNVLCKNWVEDGWVSQETGHLWDYFRRTFDIDSDNAQELIDINAGAKEIEDFTKEEAENLNNLLHGYFTHRSTLADGKSGLLRKYCEYAGVRDKALKVRTSVLTRFIDVCDNDKTEGKQETQRLFMSECERVGFTTYFCRDPTEEPTKSQKKRREKTAKKRAATSVSTSVSGLAGVAVQSARRALSMTRGTTVPHAAPRKSHRH